MQHIAIVISDLGLGGSQRVVGNLATLWAQAGVTVTVITFAGPETDFVVLPEGVCRVHLGYYSNSSSFQHAFFCNLKRLRSLRRALRKSGADTVLAFLGATNVLTIISAWGLGKRVVICERNDPALQSIGRVWDKLRRILYRFADVTTSNSRDALVTIREFVPDARLAYVPNPVLPPENPVGLSFPFKVMLTVARLTPQKGVDCLLRAFSEVAREFPDWGLVVAGAGAEEKELMKLADELNIGPQLIWAGAVADPWAYYASAELFVLPSRYEGMPNALLEAMSLAVAPLISTAIKGAEELVTDGESGRFFEVDNIDDLVSKVRELMSDSRFRRTIGTNARRAMARYGGSDSLNAWNRVVGNVQD